ncbi:latent-transforming growth factor beta-binding protein 4-like [Alexandromys fortis]|uniref:latent-transforming growth factor beta-binding protein 4-like n=1 Tax=Alexandromys fortis TaxID=100897 RepID=UPI00215356B0|nr:latent-transforming growth factor beta-binding protein 4-like [Microtus fortis]
MRRSGLCGHRPLLLLLLLSTATSASSPSPTPSSSQAVEDKVVPGHQAGVAACLCCLGQTPRRNRCPRAFCRLRNCPRDRCTDLQGCLTPTPPVSSPSPVEKRQVSLNWQPLTLQEARALLRQRRPRGPWARALLKRRPPHRAPAGQARGKNIRPSSV